jgi:ketosteroid isomerase-like protein/mannose-6-phosphate isomerase-like protein (cupin superfamily)
MNRHSFTEPDEVRTPPKTRVEVVNLDTVKVARFTMEPGWRWSECIAPIAGTPSCRARHVGAVLSGQVHVVHDDGREMTIAAGDTYVIEPGHDAWVQGSETFVCHEFESLTANTYGRHERRRTIISALPDLVHTLYRGMESDDIDLVMSVFAPDVEVTVPGGSLKGTGEVRGLLGAFLTAVPDNRLTVSRAVQQGETIVIEATYSGTHTGPLAGPDGSLPPTGLTFAFPYVDILTAREDKIVTRNIYWDNMTFLSQLGALPAAAA